MPKFGLSPKERMLENILNGLDPDNVIYRVVSVESFFEMIEEKRLVLVRPWKWEDPFEDLLSRTIVTNKAGDRIRLAVTVKGDALKILSWHHIREVINANA